MQSTAEPVARTSADPNAERVAELRRLFPEAFADGKVDVDDLLAIINGWGVCPDPSSCCLADIVAGNGVVNVDDLLLVITSLGICVGCTGDTQSMPTSVQDCMDSCSGKHPEGGSAWSACVSACVDGLCRAQIINCE